MGNAASDKKKERGSANEVEILREIIKADPFLLEKVLDKIRDVRNLSKMGLMDQMANKQVSGDERSPNKKGRVR
jgi:hypothetical protein